MTEETPNRLIDLGIEDKVSLRTSFAWHKNRKHVVVSDPTLEVATAVK